MISCFLTLLSHFSGEFIFSQNNSTLRRRPTLLAHAPSRFALHLAFRPFPITTTFLLSNIDVMLCSIQLGIEQSNCTSPSLTRSRNLVPHATRAKSYFVLNGPQVVGRQARFYVLVTLVEAGTILSAGSPSWASFPEAWDSILQHLVARSQRLRHCHARGSLDGQVQESGIWKWGGIEKAGASYPNRYFTGSLLGQSIGSSSCRDRLP